MTKNQFNDKRSTVKNKKIFAFLLITLAAVLFVATIAAYYSDLLIKSVEFKSSTLDLVGTHEIYLNGEEVTAEELGALNPGDVIVVKTQVTNQGSQSAWLRERIDLSLADNILLDYIVVYEGEFEQADFTNPAALDQYKLNLVDGIAVGTNKIIDGTVEEEEGAGSQFIGSNQYISTITIRFLPTAGNNTQNKQFTLDVEVQALQYKNNTNEPNEDAWLQVEAAL